MDAIGLFQGIVGLGTVAAGVAAIWAAIETRRLRSDERLPQLIAYMDKNDRGVHALDLIIENIGRGPAYKVRMFADTNYPEPNITKITKTALMSDIGITIIPPGDVRRYILGNSQSIGERPRHYSLVYYRGHEQKPGKPITVPVVLRISDFDGMLYLENIERKATKNLSDAMREIASGNARIEIEPSWRFQEWLDERTRPTGNDPSDRELEN